MVLYLTWQQRHSCTHYESTIPSARPKRWHPWALPATNFSPHKSHMSCSHYGMTNRKNHNTLLFTVNNMKKKCLNDIFS